MARFGHLEWKVPYKEGQLVAKGYKGGTGDSDRSNRDGLAHLLSVALLYRSFNT